MTDPKALAKLKSADRHDPDAKDGISLRWLPGAKAATYCAQGDEHNPDGSVDETAENAQTQMEKRLRKMDALKRALPEPEYFGEVKNPGFLIVSWGSNKSVILDVLKAMSYKLQARSVGYLHYTYLWPLHTKKLMALASKSKKDHARRRQLSGSTRDADQNGVRTRDRGQNSEIRRPAVLLR